MRQREEYCNDGRMFLNKRPIVMSLAKQKQQQQQQKVRGVRISICIWTFVERLISRRALSASQMMKCCLMSSDVS